MKIMVVEDSLLTRRFLEKWLKGKDHEVCLATNGREALELITEDDVPDVIITDLVMPVMDGFDFLKCLQELPIQPIKIVLSADTQKASAEQCLALGAVSVINKPVDDMSLKAIDEILRGEKL